MLPSSAVTSWLGYCLRTNHLLQRSYLAAPKGAIKQTTLSTAFFSLGHLLCPKSTEADSGQKDGAGAPCKGIFVWGELADKMVEWEHWYCSKRRDVKRWVSSLSVHLAAASHAGMATSER